MPLLVREWNHFEANWESASKSNLLPTNMFGFDAKYWIPEMGGYASVNHSGHAERRSTGPILHLQAQEFQSYGEGKARKWVSLADSGLDAG
jgi:hypothetical protein